VTAEQLSQAFNTDWSDRTREQKRLTAPYALGWEEGYAAAYRQFATTGRVVWLGETYVRARVGEVSEGE
jgi:hypothetical protein